MILETGGVVFISAVENWKNYRNEVIHGLLNKKVVSII